MSYKTSLSSDYKNCRSFMHHNNKPTCNICRIMASGALSLMFPTNTVVTGGFSSFSS